MKQIDEALLDRLDQEHAHLVQPSAFDWEMRRLARLGLWAEKLAVPALEKYADYSAWSASEIPLGNGQSIRGPRFGFGAHTAVEALAKRPSKPDLAAELVAPLVDRTFDIMAKYGLFEFETPSIKPSRLLPGSYVSVGAPECAPKEPVVHLGWLLCLIALFIVACGWVVA